MIEIDDAFRVQALVIHKAAKLASINLATACEEIDSIGLGPQHFSIYGFPTLWKFLDESVRLGQLPDSILLGERLKAASFQIEPELLHEIIHGVGDRLGLSAHHNSLRDYAQQLLEARTKSLAENKRRQIHEAILSDLDDGAAIEEVHRLLQQPGDIFGSPRAQASSFLEAYRKEKLDRAAGKTPQCLLTGISKLDWEIGRLPNDLIVIGSRPGIGKTGLLTTILNNWLMAGIRVGLFSLEDPIGSTIDRLVAHRTGLKVAYLNSSTLEPHHLKAMEDAIESLRELEPSLCYAEGSMRAEKIVQTAQKWVSVDKCRAILVDHLGELEFQRSDRMDLEIDSGLKALRSIAHSCHVPVVVLTHLKRTSDDFARPRSTDFSESSYIEKKARLALVLRKPTDTNLEVYVVKNTRGQCNRMVELEFDPISTMVKNS